MATESDGYIQLGSENTSYISVGKAVREALKVKATELGQRPGTLYKAFGSWAGAQMSRDALLAQVTDYPEDRFSVLDLFFKNGVEGQLKEAWVKAALVSMVEAGDVSSKAFKKAASIIDRLANGEQVSSEELDAYKPASEQKEAETETAEEPSEEPTEEPPKEAPKKAKKGKKAPKVEPEADVPDIAGMTLKQLKAQAKKVGLKVKGKRADAYRKALLAHFSQ